VGSPDASVVYGRRMSIATGYVSPKYTIMSSSVASMFSFPERDDDGSGLRV
jgi:hypothetical protein